MEGVTPAYRENLRKTVQEWTDIGIGKV